MFWKIFTFELKYRFRRPATYLYFFLLAAFIALVTANGGVGGVSEKVYMNSPQLLGNLFLIMSVFGLLIASAIMGVPVYRDIDHETRHYFFSFPMKERDYLLGRYLGSFVTLIFVASSLIFGVLIGGSLAQIFNLENADKVGPWNLYYLIYPFVFYVIPNMLFAGSIFFSLVALTRKISTTYTASVLLFIGYLLSGTFTSDLEYRDLVDILDPFALQTFNNATKYFSVVEQNTQFPPMAGNLLINRILWTVVGLAIFGISLLRFRFQDMLFAGKGGKKKVKKRRSKKNEEEANIPVSIPLAHLNFNFATRFRQMLRLAGLEFRLVTRDVYFIAILLGGLIFLFLDGWFGSPLYGTPFKPVTYSMLEVHDFTYVIFVYIILIFYTGEVMHRDKSRKFDGIADALPVPNWVLYGSKLIGMILVGFVLVNMPIITGVLNQALSAYFNFELGLYLQDLYLIKFPEYLQLIALAFLVHILVNRKFMGHILTIGIWLGMGMIRGFLEYNYNLWFYSYAPGYTYSDMNGFGHFVEPLFWFNLYWLLAAVIFIVIGVFFWRRGVSDGFKDRIKKASFRFKAAPIIAGVTALVLFIGVGRFIYYNVSVLNTFRTSEESRDITVDYEKNYKKYENVLQPKIYDLNLEVDLYPEERRVEAVGHFQITNKWGVAIDSIHMNGGSPIPHTEIISVVLDGKEISPAMSDTVQQYYIYKLDKPIQPGDSLSLDITVHAAYKGFRNSNQGRQIVYNGSFFDASIFPGFGYNSRAELSSDRYRKKYDLPEKIYNLPPVDDSLGMLNTLFVDDGDRISFEATVSTASDQIAVAPGYLEKEWEEDGRKYFQYKMDHVMLPFFNVVSARYDVLEDEWKGDSQTVKIQIFHHPTHKYNLDRIVNGTKKALDYFTQNFGPYQHKQMRILEFPRYAGFAQSFPNTVPFAEGFGWTGDFSDPNDYDYVFFVTAHEVAHQWWAHQVTPRATRGSNLVSEALANYSALMVAEEEFGSGLMQKFLRYELESYLRGRASENKKEDIFVENDSKGYIDYRKGSMILYALKDYIGEDQLNSALKAFRDSMAFQLEGPFASSRELKQFVEEVVPDSMNYFLEESWEKITLYENRALEASYSELEDGKYEVNLKVSAKKFYADSLGNEIDAPMNDLIEIGVLREIETEVEGNSKKLKLWKDLYRQKHWIGPGEHNFTFVVDEKPEKAGIDPSNKLIDRNPEDNTVIVSEE